MSDDKHLEHLRKIEESLGTELLDGEKVKAVANGQTGMPTATSNPITGITLVLGKIAGRFRPRIVAVTDRRVLVGTPTGGVRLATQAFKNVLASHEIGSIKVESARARGVAVLTVGEEVIFPNSRDADQADEIARLAARSETSHEASSDA